MPLTEKNYRKKFSLFNELERCESTPIIHQLKRKLMIDEKRSGYDLKISGFLFWVSLGDRAMRSMESCDSFSVGRCFIIY